jgi:hypothetical protein
MIEALHLFTHRLGVDRDFAHCPEPSHLLIDLPPLILYDQVVAGSGER